MYSSNFSYGDSPQLSDVSYCKIKNNKKEISFIRHVLACNIEFTMFACKILLEIPEFDLNNVEEVEKFLEKMENDFNTRFSGIMDNQDKSPLGFEKIYLNESLVGFGGSGVLKMNLDKIQTIEIGCHLNSKEYAGILGRGFGTKYGKHILEDIRLNKNAFTEDAKYVVTYLASNERSKNWQKRCGFWVNEGSVKIDYDFGVKHCSYEAPVSRLF